MRHQRAIASTLHACVAIQAPGGVSALPSTNQIVHMDTWVAEVYGWGSRLLFEQISLLR